MFLKRVNIKSSYAKDIIIIWYRNNFCDINPLHVTFMYRKSFWNKYINKFVANFTIPFSQTSQLICIVRYNINNELIYKKFEITNINYKSKLIIDLDNIEDYINNDTINRFENKLQNYDNLSVLRDYWVSHSLYST